MQALWLRFVFVFCCTLIANCAPAWCQDEFERHNRFKFAGTQWAKERERPPAAHDIEHAVKTGEVTMQPVPVDAVVKEVAPVQPDRANIALFGRPRQLLTESKNPPRAVVQPTAPVVVHSAEPVRRTLIPAARPEPVVERKIAHARKTTQSVAGRMVAKVPPAIEAATYPADVGYAYSGPSVLARKPNQLEVRGKLLAR